MEDIFEPDEIPAQTIYWIYEQYLKGERGYRHYIQATGDPVTDLHEDLAAEQKARTTYEHLIRPTDDPGIKDTLRFLREREVVHFQRFGEALDHVQEFLGSKKVF